MPHFLSKSDFQVARSCGTKLYYRKLNYPSNRDEDEFLKMLAQGGYMLEAIAKLLFPEGIKLTENADILTTSRATIDALKAKQITLFEATLWSKGKYARVDILVKQNQVFHLIEVKAVSYNSEENKQRLKEGKPNIFRALRSPQQITTDWRTYLEDITFQVCILEELFPDAEIVPFLMLPDRAKTTSIEGIPSLLKSIGNRFEYCGDIHKLRQDNFLTLVEVKAEVELLKPDVQLSIQEFMQSLQPELSKINTPISYHCRHCEYRHPNIDKSGFHQCWGKLAEIKPHLFDLYYLNEKIANPLIQQGQVGLGDIPRELLLKKDGSIGTQAQRQLIQIEYTQTAAEWIDPQLFHVINSCQYPLHFIDFETATLPLPYHAEMYPYEPVAFQWSCHTIEQPHGQIKHTEWIDLGLDFPNFKFAESLIQQLGTQGTVFIWSHHENTILKTIAQQLERLTTYHPMTNKSALKKWLDLRLNHLPNNQSTFVDMCKLTQKYYFHPQMGGQNSIKAVLAAIWQSDRRLQEMFPEYICYIDHQLQSPYASLPPLIINGKESVIHAGTGAVAAYHAVRYGLADQEEAVKSQWQKLLLQYCQLDTLAMVMVWLHWLHLAPKVES